MTEELNPCPFCGASASGYAIEPHIHTMVLGDFKMPDHTGSYVIEGDCACGSGLIGATQEEVTARWNTRAAPSQPEGAEPTAWRYKPSKVLSGTVLTDDPERFKLATEMGCDIEPLYLHPSQPAGAAAPAQPDPLHVANERGEGWQPIETAPKRGIILLGLAPNEEHEDGYVSPGYWMESDEDGPDNMGHDAGFVDVHFNFFSCARSFGNPTYQHKGLQPTHWMPLPAAPKEKP